MYFFRRTERASGGLGEILLSSILLTRIRARRLFPPLMELKLYSREWCSWCIDAKEYLESRGYKFLHIDVGEDRQAYEEMKTLSEQTYVPTFVAGDKVLANFDTDQLERFLSEHQINP
jgi:glutaredoxin